jgi:hypothetical protein
MKDSIDMTPWELSVSTARPVNTTGHTRMRHGKNKKCIKWISIMLMFFLEWEVALNLKKDKIEQENLEKQKDEKEAATKALVEKESLEK